MLLPVATVSSAAGTVAIRVPSTFQVTLAPSLGDLDLMPFKAPQSRRA